MKSLFFTAVVVLCLTSTALAQEVSRFEIGAGASILRDPGNLNRYGWVGSFGANINKWFAVKGEAAGNYYKGVQDDNVYSFLGGPQFNLRRDNARATPWVHFLVGVQRGRELVFTGASLSTVSRSHLAMEPGGGLDVSLNSRVGLRFGFDYVRAFREGRLRDIGNYRFQTGFVFKLP
jgi:opacity protein-like surface antigen